MKPSWRFPSGAVATVLMGLVVALAVSPDGVSAASRIRTRATSASRAARQSWATRTRPRRCAFPAAAAVSGAARTWTSGFSARATGTNRSAAACAWRACASAGPGGSRRSSATGECATGSAAGSSCATTRGATTGPAARPSSRATARTQAAARRPGPRWPYTRRACRHSATVARSAPRRMSATTAAACSSSSSCPTPSPPGGDRGVLPARLCLPLLDQQARLARAQLG